MSFNAQIAAGFARLITAINKLHSDMSSLSAGTTGSVPFFVADGTRSNLRLDGGGKVPFVKADGATTSFPLVL